MVTRVKSEHNKSEFSKDVLTKNPRATATLVNEAWKKGGRQGQISAALVNKLRATMGLTGNLRAKRKKTAFTSDQKLHSTPESAARTPRSLSTERAGVARSASKGRGLEHASVSFDPLNRRDVPLHAIEELEAEIDRLIFRVTALGGLPAVEGVLRQARRLLYGAFSKKLV
jgi:hypothetical protein